MYKVTEIVPCTSGLVVWLFLSFSVILLQVSNLESLTDFYKCVECYPVLLGHRHSSAEMLWSRTALQTQRCIVGGRLILKSSDWFRFQYLLLALEPAVHHGMVGTERGASALSVELVGPCCCVTGKTAVPSGSFNLKQHTHTIQNN